MSAPARRTSRGHRLKQGRLTELLTKREQTGTTWAETASHGLPGLGRLTVELTVIEHALTEQWPHLSEAWLHEWAVADARKLHNPDTGTRASCRICQSTTGQAAA